ncbi:MAG: hypothetical protein ACJA2C_002649, partial [Marinoscillum sp.]
LAILLSADTIAEGEVLTITVNTEIAIGAPQSFKLAVGNVANDQYTIRDIELSIPEGGTTAETILLATDDDDIEEIMNGTISLIELSEGLEWNESPSEFKITSEDVKIDPLKVEKKIEVLIYPNPASDLLHIDNLPADVKEIALVSIEGRAHKLALDSQGGYRISKFNRGVYILRITTESGEVTKTKILLD